MTIVQIGIDIRTVIVYNSETNNTMFAYSSHPVEIKEIVKSGNKI